MQKVRVELGERSYAIFIGPGLLNQSGVLFRENGIEGRMLIVTNPTVARLYLEPLLNSIRAAGYQAEAVIVPDGEAYKSLEQASYLYDSLVDGKFDRKSALIALGGGVIGDLTGFVAATYMRGIRFIQVPTTLLAQVDSSIGGKVAVNHRKGKNLIGAFYQPEMVLSDVGVFRTLPEREFHSGLVEVLKHGMILDPAYFEMLLRESEPIRDQNQEVMVKVVEGSCRIKGRIVQADEKETGMRAILNFGHTVGHALENITNYQYYKHGEAVALGILAALRIAAKHKMLEQSNLEKQVGSFFENWKLPTRIPGLSVDGILSRLYLDKKAEHGKVRWALLKRLGQTLITTEVHLETVKDTLLELGGV